MSTLAPAPTALTDTDLHVAAAHHRAAAAAAAWARAPLNPAAQAAALDYLLGPALADQDLVRAWAAAGGDALRERLTALAGARP